MQAGTLLFHTGDLSLRSGNNNSKNLCLDLDRFRAMETDVSTVPSLAAASAAAVRRCLDGSSADNEDALDLIAYEMMVARISKEKMPQGKIVEEDSNWLSGDLDNRNGTRNFKFYDHFFFGSNKEKYKVEIREY